MEEWGAGQSSPRRLRGQLEGQVAGVLEVRGLGPSCSLPLGGGSGRARLGLGLPGLPEPRTYRSCCQRGRSQGQPREGPWYVTQQVRWGLPEGPPNIFPQATNPSLPRHPLLIMRPWAERHLAPARA